MKFRLGRLEAWETPLALFGIVLLSYGLWIPWMGLFGNDIPYVWFYHLLGAWGPGEFAAHDRPFSAVFYAASTFLLGENVWAYHIFLLILRWLSSVLLVWVLGLVWPEHKRAALLAGLLLAVYPGFRQNPVAVEFILHFCVLDLFLLSLGAGLLAVQQPQRYWVWMAVSVVGSAGLFWLEYFFGLEILRPIFLWLVARRQGLTGRRQWHRILRSWLPVLGVVLAFLIWRVFIFSFPTYKPLSLQELRANPLVALLGLAQTAARDLWTAFAGAWLQTLDFPRGGRALGGYLALVAAAVGLVVLLWLRAGKAPGGSPQRGAPYFGESMFGIGLAAMLAGGAIFWLTGIPVSLEFPWDRSTLSYMVGACLAITGLLEMALVPRYRLVFAAGLVALAVGMHFINAREYRAEWRKLQDFYWQLTWRAPQLEPGTLALFDVIPLNRYSDNDLTAMLNWTYSPGRHSREIEYKFFDLNLRLGGQYTGLPGLEKGLPIEVSHRGATFKSTTSSMLVISYSPPSCLRVLYPEDTVLPGITDNLAKVLPLSRPDLISAGAEPARPPAPLGSEPARGWCYYFQKADLARQEKNYNEVVALGNQASDARLRPEDLSEWLPFIEGYAETGNMERAKALNDAVAKKAELIPALCKTWKAVGENMPDQAQAIQKELGCKP